MSVLFPKRTVLQHKEFQFILQRSASGDDLGTIIWLNQKEGRAFSLPSGEWYWIAL